MLAKTYGLVYRKGRWHVKNYGRALKKGGLTWGNAKILAWWRNKKGKTPIIEFKRIVPQPGTKEEYEPMVGHGENERLAGSAPISTSEAYQTMGLVGASILGHVTADGKAIPEMEPRDPPAPSREDDRGVPF